MTRLLFSIILLLSMLAIAPIAAADNDTSTPASAAQEVEETPDKTVEESAAEPPARRMFDADHRKEMYEASRLSHRTALLYSLALPGFGNFYVEQYALGTVMITALVFSGMFIGFGLVNNQPNLLQLGAIGAVLTYTGAAASSYIGVSQYNDQLRRGLHVDRRATTSQHTNTPDWTIGWSWRF